MLTILDTAIGLAFIFLLFSLVVTALNEVILTRLDRRAAFLREGIKEMFRDSVPGNATITADQFFRHGMITVLSRGKYKDASKKDNIESDKPADETEHFPPRGIVGIPSYVPGKSFVLALLSLLTDGKNPTGLGNLRPTIEALGNTELKETLLALYDDADGRLDHFKANIENWFNESMDRVGGWYKHHAQKWLLGLSLGLAITCNIDSIRIIRALSVDTTLRDGLIQQATTYLATATPLKTNPATASSTTSTLPPATTAPTPSSNDPTAAAIFKEKDDQLKSAFGKLESTGIPLGWSDGASRQLVESLPKPWDWWSGNYKFSLQVILSFLGLWLSSLIGWSITGLAASLGAPFWFDTLNRFIDIRGVGRAPEESDTTAPKKPSTGVESFVITGDSLKSLLTNDNQAAVQAITQATGGVAVQHPAPAAQPTAKRKPQSKRSNP